MVKVEHKHCAKRQRKGKSRKQLVHKTPTSQLKQKTNSAQNTNKIVKVENK